MKGHKLTTYVFIEKYGQLSLLPLLNWSTDKISQSKVHAASADAGLQPSLEPLGMP